MSVPHQMYQLANACFLQGSPWTIEQFEQFFAQDYIFFYQITREQTMVGFVLGSKTEYELEIYLIGTHPSYQCQGVASELLDLILVDYKHLPIYLEVRSENHAARCFYEKKGFKQLGTRKNYYNQPLDDAVLLGREG